MFLRLILIALLSTTPAIAQTPRGAPPPHVAVCFTPGEDCEGRIVAAICAARRQILIQAYGFTSVPIISAVKAAAARGVEVLIILDKSNDRGRYSAATYLSNAGIPVWIDTASGIAHNKVMIIDREIVLTGSYNFTKAAKTRNAENLLMIASRAIALRFEANWNARFKLSRSYDAANLEQRSAQD
ncbi:phospholipase D family nuclease [Labrys neptuniae]